MMTLKPIHCDKPVAIKPLNKEIRYNKETKAMDECVYSFILTNDNYPNCAAHTKYLDANEMMAIYEYMKKIVEKA